MIDIVVRHIVGWDDKKHCASEKGGVFGQPIACSMAVEEQGRKTLHGHFLIWIEGWKELLEKLCSERDRTRNDAGMELKTCVDLVVSTKLHDEEFGDVLHLHTCSDGVKWGDTSPEPVTHQQLRNMRHKGFATADRKTAIMTCPVCKHKFTSEECVHNVLKSHHIGLPGVEGFPKGKGCEWIDVPFLSTSLEGGRLFHCLTKEGMTFLWPPNTTTIFPSMHKFHASRKDVSAGFTSLKCLSRRLRFILTTTMLTGPVGVALRGKENFSMLP